MLVILIKIFIILDIPLILFILGRGIRLDRIFFIFYLITFLFASYLLVQPPESQLLHAAVFLLTLDLFWINLFFFPQGKIINDKKIYRKGNIIFLPLLPFPLTLITLFYFDYSPELFKNYFYFSQPLYPTLTLISIVFSLLMLTLGWERMERIHSQLVWEKLFRIGIIMWWIVILFILSRMIYTGDMVSISFFQLLFCLHLFWLIGIYPLMYKKEFLEVRIHPSPQFMGRATQSILILIVLTLFFWFEALSKKWGIPPYSVTMISVLLLAGILLFPLFPFRSFEGIQRILYHHLYLPEQDFALEVSHYLKVMRGEENLEKIIEHLRNRLQIEAAALYRLTKSKENKWNLYLSCPPSDIFPSSLNVLPNEGTKFTNLFLIKKIPLKAREETLGFLLLLGRKNKFRFEEESLIRFWSSTLGLLLKELETKEKEKEQERLAFFSQAASFLLHDAKNLAQLLELLLKNYHNLKREELAAFFTESLPALEQARSRARRILEKLKTFQPDVKPLLKNADLSQILKEVIDSLQLSLKKQSLLFHAQKSKAPWKGDPNALKTIMENLILNGLQSKSKEGKVEVILSEEEKGYHIQVKDEGEGVPEENQEKIFEPFFTTRPSGSGLGLYQAKILIERMGGKIWYEPNSPKGSIFHVWISKDSSR